MKTRLFFSLIVVALFAAGFISAVAHSREYVSVGTAGFQAPKNHSARVAKKLEKRPSASTGSSRSYVSASGKIKLFGTVEFGKPVETFPAWLDVLARNSDDPIFQLQKHFNKSTTWEKLKTRLDGKSSIDQLKIVNSFWNGWPYKDDKSNWGREDYWAAPAQFLVKSGDCEDYAIVKYFTLKEIGVDPKSMRVVVLRDTVRNLAHAVLAVYINNDAYILDNVSNSVLSHKNLVNYSPQFSINEYGRWAHMFPKSG